MKATFVLLAVALCYVHVARGAPNHGNMDKAPQADAAAPAAPQAQAPAQADVAAAPLAQAPQAAPSADDKPETCKASINGQDQTLNTGDRYCLDDTTHRVCNYGEWIDNKCPDGSKCLKSPTSYQVLCRIVNRNPPQVIPQDAQNDNAAKSPDASPAAPSNPSPQHEDKPLPPLPVGQPPNPAPTPDQASTPAQAPPPAPTPSQTQDKPAPAAPPAPTPTQTQDKPAPQQSGNSTDSKPETCKATINGQDQTLQPGDRYCLDDSTNRVCNWGEFVDYACPSGSKCLKSPDKWQVLCRIINKNPAQNTPTDNQ